MDSKKFFTNIFIVFAFLMLFISLIFSEVNAKAPSSYYIKNSIKPTKLYVISLSKMTDAEKAMIVTLQGQVNNRSTSQIYTLSLGEPDYEIWLRDLKDNYSIEYELIEDPWEVLNKFKDYVDGYVIYSKNNKNDPSINNASSLAALKNSIIVEKSIEEKVKSKGITKLQGDCSNTDKYWAYDNLWNKGLNHSIIVQLSPTKAGPLRDYAIMTKSLIFYEDNPKDFSLRDKVFKAAKKDSICLGWGPDEYNNIKEASKYGVNTVPSDWTYNLTVLSSFPSLPITQNSHPKVIQENNVHYVTFIMSDGDNQQWNLGKNYASPKWYGSKDRGNFNMGWTITPSLYDLAPTVLKLYYKNAKFGINNDNFVVSPSGNGYMYPSKFDETALNIQIKKLNTYMKNTDQKYVSILDDWALDNVNLWDKYTKQPNIHGLFYLNFSKQNDYKGKIIWSNNKPIVSCRDLLWSKLEDNDQLVNKINSYVSSGYTDVNFTDAYTFVYVHAWSKTMSDVQYVVDQLSNNSKVRIVTPDEFMQHVMENVKH
ncbi:GxGYxYP domain-containing protein [Clostridium pasteurianum]|uniref:Protein phosphatase n=1 Tax=Clostridium pasteurianum BC1 TaxID=86416 RepID=R4K6Q5_CLOPA|nr:GxGYxYP domain-containing protein [Clostridium pasteurianum]AGK98867.1 hypothetical protein Clopa_4132 [Clostridium pasteurianum BC1]